MPEPKNIGQRKSVTARSSLELNDTGSNFRDTRRLRIGGIGSRLNKWRRGSQSHKLTYEERIATRGACERMRKGRVLNLVALDGSIARDRAMKRRSNTAAIYQRPYWITLLVPGRASPGCFKY